MIKRQDLTLTQERILRAFESLDTQDGRRLRSVFEVRARSGLCGSAVRRNLKLLVSAGFLEEFHCGAGRAHGLRYKRKELTVESIEGVKTGFYLLLDDLGKPLQTERPLTTEGDAYEAAKVLLRSGEAPRVIVCKVLANHTPADLPPVVVYVKPPPVKIEGKAKITLWAETRRFDPSKSAPTCQAVGCEAEGEREITFNPDKDYGEPEDKGHRVSLCGQHFAQFREEHAELEVYGRGSLDLLWVVTAKGRARRPKPEPEEVEE